MILNKDTDYISASELLLEVENSLSTFVERSLVDNSIFYPVIKRCLTQLGLRALPTTNIVVQVKDYEARLPYDFYKLLKAVGCSTSIRYQSNDNPNIYEIYDSSKFTSFSDDYLLKPNEVRIDEEGDEYYVIQRYETFALKYTDFFPLSVSGSSQQYCTGNCINKKTKSPNQIDISGNKLTASFSEGSIYIEYLQNLDQETTDGLDLLIPNFGPITSWIIYKCMYKGIEKVFLNSEADVAQKLTYLKNESAVAEVNAMSFVSRHSVKEFYMARKQLFSRYNKFNQMVYGHGHRKTTQGYYS